MWRNNEREPRPRMSAWVPALRLVRYRVLRPTFPVRPLIPLILSRGRSAATAGRRVVARAAVRDVLVLHGSTRALVNLLPAHLTGKLLAELDAYRCTQTALALVGVHHLGRGHRHLARLGVLRVLHRHVQVRIHRDELLAHGHAEALQHVRLHRLHVLRHRSLHNRRLDTCVTTCLLANFVEGQRTIRNWHGIETMGAQLSVLFSIILHFCHGRKGIKFDVRTIARKVPADAIFELVGNSIIVTG